MAFVREQQIYTRRERGEEMKEVRISVISEGQKKYYGEKRRRKKTAVASPKQKTLNDRHAREYFEQLANTNFGKNDLLLTTTYADGHLPATADEGDDNVRRMLRRLAKTYAKLGVPFRYIFTTSFSTGRGESKEIVRMHHHILLSGGVPREVIEDAWRAKSDKPGQLGELLGFANVKRLQPDESGITAVCVYFFKQAREGIRRRWHASVGLKKPLAVTPNDESYDFRDLERIRVRGSDAPEVSFWERRYPGWTLAGLGAVTVRESELSGTSVRVRLRKIQDKKVQKARKGGLKA
nr:MAG TPA: protein of unknown function DUF1424 [Caudoviricetes sp.]